jgi:hypothetical protein
MPRVSAEKREEAFEFLRNGASTEDVVETFGVSAITVEKWRAEATGEPTAVSPPSVKMTGRGKKKHAVKPISDETAGMIAAAVFSIAALVDQEPCWYLTDVERKALAEPLAESLKLLPSPVADAVNAYTAPGVLITVSATIINHKLQYRAAKRTGKLRAVPNSPRSQTTPAHSQGGSVANDNATPPNNQEVNQTVATSAPTKIDDATANALAQARGALADEGEENGEGLLSSGLS